MELKGNAYLAFGLFALLLVPGYLMASTVFLLSSAVLAVLIALDYALLRYRLASARRHVAIRCGIRPGEPAPGRRARLKAEIAYSGDRPLTLSLSLPADDGVRVSSIPARITLAPGKTAAFEAALSHPACGERGAGPLIGSVETTLLKASIPLGDRLKMRVRLPVGRRLGRPDGVHRQDMSFVVGDILLDEEWGSDFSEIRNYVPGDNVRFIDWTRTIKYGTIFVKEFESERSMPTVILADVATLGQNPAPGRGVRVISAVIDKLMYNNEPIGLISFSRDAIVHHIRPYIGQSHIQGMIKSLSEDCPAAPADVARPYLFQLKEMSDLGRAYDEAAGRRVMEPIFDETLKAYSARILNDGFIKAMRQAIADSGRELNIIVVTGLSMGLSCLTSGARVALSRGHHVTVVLLPSGDDPRSYAAAASKLRQRSIGVMLVPPDRNPERQLYEGRVKSHPRALRG